MAALEFPVRNRALAGTRIYPRTLLCREGFKNIQGTWSIDDNQEKYENNKTSGILPEKYNDPSVVQYSYNSIGYRTKEFEEFTPNEFILCIGCSYTEGTGLNNSEVWHHLLGEHFNLPIMNLGFGGAGGDISAFNTLQYIKNKLPKPKLVIFQWPQTFRKMFVSERHRNEPFLIQSVVPSIDITSPNIVEDLDLQYMQNRYIVYKELAYVEQYTYYMTANTAFKAIGVPTFNFTFNNDNDYTHNYLFNSLQMKTVVAKFGLDEEYDFTKPDVARDGAHPGTRHQEKYAEVLLSDIGEILNAI